MTALSLPQTFEQWQDAEADGDDAVRALILEDRYYLLVSICGRWDMVHPWIFERCREVEADPDGNLDIWGREHYKSTIITYGGCIQEILRDPEITIGLFSHTKPTSKAFLAQIKRELESNQKLQQLFPDILHANPAKEALSWSLDGGIIVKRKSNPKEATIEANGLVDGQPTSKHYRLLVYDDVVTKESVGTPEQITKTTEAWELSDNLGCEGGRKWHVGTRYSFGDTYQSIIERGSLKLRHRPATHDGSMHGKPVLLSQETWDKKCIDQGEATISCQMLGNPLAGHQRMFDVNDLQVYEIRPETIGVYIMVDPARSKKKGSANTAMVAVAIDYAGNKYLIDGWDHKMDLQERWQRMRDLWLRWRSAPGVQSCRIGYERYGAIADLDYFNERKSIEKCSGLNIEELEWPFDGEASKIDRVQRLGPDLRNHRFFLPYPTDHENLTSAQRRMKESGYEYRISRPIKRKDENGHLYDLSERLKMQVHFFPFGGLKDVIDATARIYDMDPKPPMIVDQSVLEPEYV